MATFAELMAGMDAVEAKVAEAEAKILDTVAAETQEDVDQNAMIASLKAEVAALEAELAGSVTGAEADALMARIAGVNDRIAELEAKVVVTDPTPAEPPVEPAP